ncbi:unnamed protein product [Hymenolepis diminuta]|uniref:Uncharacterized protein n=1 Tax=Hymenolepis diminuta TaxID=6216 RepID=A0A564XZF6_HYMDI|nr:unnamed protein product [Hymenolepis diminuta]
MGKFVSNSPIFLPIREIISNVYYFPAVFMEVLKMASVVEPSKASKRVIK